jgi:hypothetical protein
MRELWVPLYEELSYPSVTSKDKSKAKSKAKSNARSNAKS